MEQNLGKILIITDVHARIKEMNDFFREIQKKEQIDYAIHLGDFWSGRNYNPQTGTQEKDEWDQRDFLDQLELPVYHLKGNEDLTQPDDWWLTKRMWLMRDQEPFYLNTWKVLPIFYQYRGEEADTTPKHPEYGKEDGIDIVISHRPPLGILDDTLHFKTHQKLSGTGSPMVRAYYDAIRPSLFAFGHFHYSNFIQTDYGLVVCIDKLIRLGGKDQNEYRYSYGLLDPFDQSLEVVWKNRPFFKYSILEQKLMEVNRFDRRDLYNESKKKKKWPFRKNRTD